LRFDRFVLDLTRECLRAGDRDIDLRRKTFGVLRHLPENAGRLVPKKELHEIVWRNVVVSDDSLVQCVRELRQALGDDNYCLIKTVSRRGCLMDVTVSTSDLPSEFPTASASPVKATSATASLVPSLDQGDGKGGVASLVGITGGVISGLSKPSQNRWLAPPWRLRHVEASHILLGAEWQDSIEACV
jgi:DNA-binding winged helix-turn-helix (wHTH) protein